MTTLPLLTAQDLCVTVSGQTLLSIASLEIYRGEVLAIIGPNGAGKSTLLQSLACLRQQTSGVLEFDGQVVDLHDPPLAFRRRLAVVFQEPLLFDTTVEGNVASGLKLRRVEKKMLRTRVDTWLELLGIRQLAHRQARTLSGGEAQRTSLARAFALEPDLLLLDEPFSALDAVTREALTETFYRLQRQTQVTTLFVTHDRLEALRVGTRIAVMDKGAIVQLGSPEEVFSQPVNETVANFVGVETILRGAVESQVEGFAHIRVGPDVSLAVSSFLPIGAKATVCIRPEEVTLLAFSEGATSEAGRQSSSARNHFPGRVNKILPWGVVFKAHIDCGFPLVAFVTRPSVEELDLRDGQTVIATFKATSVHVIAEAG